MLINNVYYKNTYKCFWQNVYLNLGNIYKEIAIFPMVHVSNCFPKGLTIWSTSWSQFSSDYGGRPQMEENKEPYYKAAFAY